MSPPEVRSIRFSEGKKVYFGSFSHMSKSEKRVKLVFGGEEVPMA
jgi:hypothetical protein